MPFTLPPITLTQNQTSLVSLPGSMGSVSYLKLVNASPYLLQITNLLGGSDYMQPGEANVWPVPGLTTAVQVTPQQFGVSPAIIPSTVLVVTWYLEGERPNGNYPVNFNTISFLGSSVTTNASTPNSINQDEWTPFVLNGLVATKDGSVANKLDVTGGVAWLRQTDQSLGRVAENATTFTTVQINSTYYLDLNPDGTYAFGTSHSGQPNYLAIAQVTTDASGNISTVTDERTLNTTLFSAMAGGVDLTADQLSFLGGGHVIYSPSLEAMIFFPLESGASVQGLLFRSWDGSTARNTLGIGGGFAGAFSYFNNVGALAQVNTQATVGSFGVPLIVAQANNVNVTTTALTTVLSYTPGATGLYRISGSMNSANGGVNKPNLQYTFTGGTSNTSQTTNMAAPNGAVQNGSQTNINNWDTNLGVQSFYAKGGSAITVQYQNNSGTPNDHVTIIIERLA